MASVTADTSQLSMEASSKATTAVSSMLGTFESSVASTDPQVLKTVGTQMVDVIGNLLKSSNTAFEPGDNAVRDQEILDG